MPMSQEAGEILGVVITGGTGVFISSRKKSSFTHFLNKVTNK